MGKQGERPAGPGKLREGRPVLQVQGWAVGHSVSLDHQDTSEELVWRRRLWIGLGA